MDGMVPADQAGGDGNPHDLYDSEFPDRILFDDGMEPLGTLQRMGRGLVLHRLRSHRPRPRRPPRTPPHPTENLKDSSIRS